MSDHDGLPPPIAGRARGDRTIVAADRTRSDGGRHAGSSAGVLCRLCHIVMRDAAVRNIRACTTGPCEVADTSGLSQLGAYPRGEDDVCVRLSGDAGRRGDATRFLSAGPPIVIGTGESRRLRTSGDGSDGDGDAERAEVGATGDPEAPKALSGLRGMVSGESTREDTRADHGCMIGPSRARWERSCFPDRSAAPMLSMATRCVSTVSFVCSGRSCSPPRAAYA